MTEQELKQIFSNKKYAVVRASCCWKKRKSNQCHYIDGYDSSSWACKSGYGCRKNEKKKINPRDGGQTKQ